MDHQSARSLVLRSANSSAKDLRGLRSSAVGDTEEDIVQRKYRGYYRESAAERVQENVHVVENARLRPGGAEISFLLIQRSSSPDFSRQKSRSFLGYNMQSTLCAASTVRFSYVWT